MAKTKHKRKKRHDSLVLQLMILVAIVLVVFEGRLVVTMVTHRSSVKSSTVTDSTAASAVQDGTLQTQAANIAKNSDTVLAGLPTVKASSVAAASATPETHATTSDPSSSAIVPEAATSVDDSYFKDAAFIGDSRMQGFQNASGITQGTFFTSVGMSLSTMQTGDVIRTTEGNITVAAALSGSKYNKVYIMLGANDLGEYDWDSFHDGFTSCLQRFQEIQPDAIFYICSVIYVEESKVEGGSYVNNDNVDKINSILLQVCEEQGYHYLDLNEVLSDGYGSLIEGASSDGVHIYEKYCKMMLDYLKSHYVTADASDTKSETGTEAETESETEASNSGTV